jgi:hypothetical protein
MAAFIADPHEPRPFTCHPDSNNDTAGLPTLPRVRAQTTHKIESGEQRIPYT